MLFEKVILKVFSKFESVRWAYQYRFYRQKYDLSKSFRFNGKEIILYGEGKIIIGDNTYIGSYSSIQSVEGCVVEIGSNCKISHYVKIYTKNYDSSKIILGDTEGGESLGNVKIGNNCWIGAGVFIKEGITIGNNCVIAANTVVYKDIPDGSVVSSSKLHTIKSSKLNYSETKRKANQSEE